MNNISEQLNRLNDLVDELHLKEFKIQEFSAEGALTIAASSSLTYYSLMQIRFDKVSFINVPTKWDSTGMVRFRKSNRQELGPIANYINATYTDQVFAIDTLTDIGWKTFYIVANGLTLSQSVEYHFQEAVLARL